MVHPHSRRELDRSRDQFDRRWLGGHREGLLAQDFPPAEVIVSFTAYCPGSKADMKVGWSEVVTLMPSWLEHLQA